jgi:hypothetical protein
MPLSSSNQFRPILNRGISEQSHPYLPLEMEGLSKTILKKTIKTTIYRCCITHETGLTTIPKIASLTFLLLGLA